MKFFVTALVFLVSLAAAAEARDCSQGCNPSDTACCDECRLQVCGADAHWPSKQYSWHWFHSAAKLRNVYVGNQSLSDWAMKEIPSYKTLYQPERVQAADWGQVFLFQIHVKDMMYTIYHRIDWLFQQIKRDKEDSDNSNSTLTSAKELLWARLMSKGFFLHSKP